MDRTADLQADYDALGDKLVDAEGSAAAALVRERRILRALLAEVADGEEDSVADKLATNVTRLDARRGSAGDRGAATGRRKSG